MAEFPSRHLSNDIGRRLWAGMGLDTWKPHWGVNYRYTLYAGASRWFRWPATYVPSAGRYDVYAMWNDFAWATNAPYTVYHDGGSTTVRVNQHANSYTWVKLGTFDLTPGSGTLVELTGDANNNIVADAIKLVRARNVEEGTWSFVDNTQATVTGTWTASTSTAGGPYHGTNWLYAAAGGGESSIEFPMAVTEAGRYNVIAHCPQAAGNTTAARYTVHHDGGTTEVPVNQQVNGWDWVPIGTYSLTPGAGAKVTLNNAQAGTVCADAIAFGRDRNDRRVVADAVKFVPNTAEAALAVHADHLGTPQKMTDNTGAVVWDAAYRPFGEEAAISGAAANNQRFPGQYFDAETGLHYNWMRDYDPALGRYVQSDLIGLGGGWNTYAYVGGNPFAYSDVDGLKKKRGGPYHPPKGVKTKCKEFDLCPTIKGKIWLLKRMISSHEGWDESMPPPRGGGRHAQEIRDLNKQLADCEALYARKCRPCPPKKRLPHMDPNSRPPWWLPFLIPFLTPWPDPI